MSEGKGSGKKLDKFFDGKGFYIVLSICVALLGVSAYYLLTGNGTDVEENTSLSENYADDNRIEPPDVAEVTQAPDENSEANASEDPEDAEVWNEEEANEAVSSAMIWPVNGEVELPYSMTSLIYNKRLGDWRTHSGVDISAAIGTQVLSCGSGVVEKVYKDDMNGMTVIIQHAGGLRSIYANLASTPTVCEGDNVMTGEVIGSVGATAVGVTEENPQLFFSMTLDGQTVDPAAYLPAK